MNLQMSVPGAAKSLGTLYGDSYDLHASGPSAVSAIAAAKNGADVAFCTKLGNDANGERLMTCFNACRIDTSYVKKSAGLQTGFVFTAYDSMNSNSYVAKGANSALSKADIDDAFACFPDIMLVPQDYMPMSAESYSKSDFENSRIDLEIGTAQENFRQITEPKTSRPDNLALYAINKAMERGVEMVVEYTDKTSLLPLEKIQSGIKIVVISDEMLQKVTG
ncbi:MAG: hypothetical protein KBS59_06820, partial [Clostridiales bacterium]|nr:hypothetical protein [Clostridiales bacterium]